MPRRCVCAQGQLLSFHVSPLDNLTVLSISCSSLVQHVKAQLASNPRFQQAMDDITEFHPKTGSPLPFSLLPRSFPLVYRSLSNSHRDGVAKPSIDVACLSDTPWSHTSIRSLPRRLCDCCSEARDSLSHSLRVLQQRAECSDQVFINLSA